MAKDKLPPGLKLRQLAAARLRDVFSGSSFTPFTAPEIADSRDRALANRLVTTALRRHGHLRLVVARLLDKGLPRKSGSFEAILHLSLAQLLYLPEMGAHSALFLGVEALKRDPRARHLAGLLNAVLRRAQAEAVELREAPLRLLFPEKLREGWTASYGADAVEAFGSALLDGAPLDLTLKHDNPALVELLGARPIAGDTIRIDSRDRPLDQLPGYADGRWWVQDAAAALPARLLRLPAGSRVLDLCAAPGGKTAQLVKAGYDVTALDNDPQRLQRLRELAQIQVNAWAYHHSAIVTTIRTAKNHGFIARQRFSHQGPLALLPLQSGPEDSGRHCSIVWSLEGDLAERMMALEDAAFCAELTRASEACLGPVEWADQRHAIPLWQRHASEYGRAGFALVGDAAHTIHPLAGQGVNLGLYDAQVLATEILRAHRRGIPLSHESLVQRYQRQRKFHNLAAMASMEGFKRLFGASSPSLLTLRNRGMGWVDNQLWLKRLLMQVIEARNLTEMAAAIDDSIRGDFGLDAASVMLIGGELPVGSTTGALHVISEAEAEQTLGVLLDGDRAVCGQFREADRDFLFPGRDEPVASVALVPLRTDRLLGVFAVGSCQPGYFDQSMGSLFLSYISDTLSRLLPPMLQRHRQVEPLLDAVAESR